jgi:transcriptional regulator with XRE-family HTH domain
MSRMCQQCGRQLSAYNQENRCGACATAARNDPRQRDSVRPAPTFWFRPDVCAALGAWDWQTVLIAVGKETGATQTRLAAAIGLSQAQVSRLMSGATLEPGIRTVLSIVDRLGIPRILAGLAPHGLAALATQDSDGVTVGRVKRREFGRRALGLTLAVPLAGMSADEPFDITRLEPNQVVSDLYALDDRYGGGAIADIARRRLLSLTHQLDQASLTPSAEARAHAVIGAVGTCAAWLSFDAGDIDRARKLDADALYAAHQANDKHLQVEVLADMALQARDRDRPAEAVNLAESAMTIARGLDPLIHSLLSIRIASAAAQQRDRERFQRYRGRAWRLLEKARDTDRPAWLRFYGESELMAAEANGLMELEQYDEAAAILGQVVATRNGFVRNKASYAAIHAMALLHAKQLDEAIAVVHDTLPVFTEVHSARLTTRLGKVRSALRPYVRDNADAATCYDILTGLLPQAARPSHA